MSLAEASADLSLWVWDLPRLHLRLGRARALFGAPAEEMLTFSRFLACLHPDDRKNVQEEMERAAARRLISGGIPVWDRWQRPVVAGQALPARLAGQPERMIGVS